MPDFACILLVEDEENDVFLMRRAFEAARVPNPLHVACDGLEAKHYLAGEGIYADRRAHPFPCLLVTDIKMPRMDGFELLQWLQAQPREHLRRLPAIAFSSSCHENDLRRALQLGARAYKIKPPDFRELVAWAKELHATWLTPL